MVILFQAHIGKGAQMQTGLRDVTEYCSIRIDKDGRWYYEGNEIINEHVLAAFCNALEKDNDGRYRIVIEQEVCYVEVEDTPFVVASIRGDTRKGLSVLLNTAAVHELDPATLSIGENNVLYCTLQDGMRVRFSRAAYYLLAQMMEKDNKGNIVLKTGNTVHVVCSAEE
jgi:hypothetical protein